jgi:hypothetical protein
MQQNPNLPPIIQPQLGKYGTSNFAKATSNKGVPAGFRNGPTFQAFEITSDAWNAYWKDPAGLERTRKMKNLHTAYGERDLYLSRENSDISVVKTKQQIRKEWESAPGKTPSWRR